MSNETRRILLVEDEKAIRDAVTAYLERENYCFHSRGYNGTKTLTYKKHVYDNFPITHFRPCSQPPPRHFAWYQCLPGGRQDLFL